MEFQFSIPIAGPKDDATTSSSAPASQPADAPSTKRGTHRFALESRTKHTRRSSARARTGCSTCKKRHVKCDETKPACLNCIKWRGYCDGYSPESSTTNLAPPASKLRTASSSSSSEYPTAAQLIHTKKAPLILTEPLVNSNRFSNNDQRAYFDEWSTLSTSFLSGGLGKAKLWTTTMPQLSLEEKTLRFGAMAVGALRKACALGNPSGLPNENSRHYFNAIAYYCEALRMQSQSKPTREGLRTALLSSLLFICFESQRGNIPAALKHIVHGFNMLNELSSCSDTAPDLVSIAAAPPSLVQEILDCYRPLEIQARSFMGSYRKFFFNSREQATVESSAPNVASSQGSSSGDHNAPGHMDTARSSLQAQREHAGHVPSTQSRPWDTPAPRVPPTGLPSPQSQDSPQSQASQSSESSSQASPPPPRPPGIAPFTKHTPYFRPKQTNITSIDDMPSEFTSFEEAQGYWLLLQKHMVGYIPVLTKVTSRLLLHEATSDEDLDMRLSSVKQDPKISGFVAESRYWLQRWIESFDPHYQAVSNNSNNDPDAYYKACSLRVEYFILFIYKNMTRYSGIEVSKSLTPAYREIVELCEVLLRARPTDGFAMDTGWTWPLFVSAFSCRDASVREDAICLLERYPMRNSLRDSRVFRAIALKNHFVEIDNALDGDDEDRQWLRLRRREVVFEDFGASIIYRYAKRDPVRGGWRFVEEQAEFKVDQEGRLTWREQPISNSASILSGVC